MALAIIGPPEKGREVTESARTLGTGAVYPFDGEDQAIFVFYGRKTEALIKISLAEVASFRSIAATALPLVATFVASVVTLVPFVVTLAPFVATLAPFVAMLASFVATLAPSVASVLLFDRTAVANAVTFAKRLATSVPLLAT